MPAITVLRSDTFEQWRVKTNSIGTDLFDLESNLDTTIGSTLGYTKNASAAITAGSINGTTIGASSRSTGAFTTLSANGAVTFDGVSFADNVPSDTLVVTDAGNIGVGKSNPATKLDVNGTVTATAFAGNITGSTGNITTITSTTGNITTVNSTTVNDTLGNIRVIPQNTYSDVSSYTLQASDAGKHINITGSGGVTVPAGVFTVGQVITVFNNTAGNRTIAQGSSVTLYQAGVGSTGSRTLATRGLASILCVASNTFAVTGVGLT
jgi:hypothetical protein